MEQLSYRRPKNDIFYYPKPPLRPKNGFLYFVMYQFKQWRTRHRKRKMRENPKKFLADVTQVWKITRVNDPEKRKYIEQGKADVKRYQTELKEWKRNFTNGRIPKVLRKPKNPDEPKRVRNSFIYFQADALPMFRSMFPEISHQELLQLISEKWRRMSGDERLPYYNKCNDDRARYKREIKAYRIERTGKLNEMRFQRKIQRLEELRCRNLAEKRGREENAAETKIY